MQFIHLSAFGRSPRPGGKRHETAIAMLREAARVPSASTHIPEPSPPLILYGINPVELIPAIKSLSDNARDRRGRRLRSDAGLLVAAVVSFPVPSPNENQSEQDYLEWRKLVIGWLLEQFPTTLQSVVEHRDESHWHLHVMLIPPLTQKGQLDWKECHPGRFAKVQAEKEGAGRSQADQAYKAAMRKLQDRFYLSVSERVGHARVGLKRARRERHQHLAMRALEIENEKLLQRLAVLEAELASLKSDTGTGKETSSKMLRRSPDDVVPWQPTQPGAKLARTIPQATTNPWPVYRDQKNREYDALQASLKKKGSNAYLPYGRDEPSSHEFHDTH